MSYKKKVRKIFEWIHDVNLQMHIFTFAQNDLKYIWMLFID